jgi:hypothetical protein
MKTLLIREVLKAHRTQLRAIERNAVPDRRVRAKAAPMMGFALAAIEMGNATGSGENTHRTIIFRHDGITSAYRAYIRWVSGYEDRNFVRCVRL